MMASINDRRSIGQEIVLRVRSSGTGVKVVMFDGTGFADGIMTKDNRQYFYGDDAEERATDYAHRTQEKLAESRDCPVTVVELGDTIAEKLADTEGGESDAGE